MKTFNFLCLTFIFWSIAIVNSQVPKTDNADYSSKTGSITDSRDGKVYAYKKYGSTEWFMQNVAYEGALTNPAHVGLFLPKDPQGEVYGMLYPSTNTLSTAIMTQFCPEGWKAPSKGEYMNLYDDIINEYDLADVVKTSDTYANLGKYLRAGGVDGTEQDGLWESGTIIDAKSAQIGFNALPSGVFNKTAQDFDKGDSMSTKASFAYGGFYQYFMRGADNEEVKSTNRNSRHHAAIRCIRYAPVFPDIEIATPYPTSIEIMQINSADKEKTRLRQSMKKYDHVITGFYIAPEKELKIKVETLTASTDAASPRIIIGTRGQINNSVKDLALKEGLNTITANMHEGGLIYFRYVTDVDAEPQGKIRISFVDDSQQTRAPKYVYGTTSDEEFASMMGKYVTPEAIFYSDYLLAVATRDRALTYSMKEDKNKWINGLHFILEKEDEISGLDNSDANAMHHRMKSGEIRYLMIENASTSPHATDWYTAYPENSVNRYLTYSGTYGQPWMLGHEVGHQHQQSAYQINKSTESTVNIYTWMAFKEIDKAEGRPEPNRTPEAKWDTVQKYYLSLPIEERIYDMADADLQELNKGINRDEVRFMPWEQFFFVFGDQFYKTLHRITREEHKAGGNEQERRFYLIWTASRIAGYDLRNHFDNWGIRVTEDYTLLQMNKKFEEANLPLPPHNDEIPLYLITPYNKPSWIPLALQGITTSSPEEQSPDSQPEDQMASRNKYCDYSKTSNIVDARDGKTYRYKNYGEYDWFVENLNWDGYDGIDESSRKTLGYNSSEDINGLVYGRLYPVWPTNAANNAVTKAYENWCPSGWTVPTKAEWDELFIFTKDTYSLTSSTMTSCLWCGGDRDEVADGLWAKGAAGHGNDPDIAKEMGFNALPAGVYNKNLLTYENADAIGLKANFVVPSSTYYSEVMLASSDIITYPNRNSHHNGSIRCIRPKVGTSIKEVVAPQSNVYFDQASQTININSSNVIQEVSVFDISGKNTYKNNVDSKNNVLIINTNGWNRGVYIVKTQGLGSVDVVKVLVR